MSTLFIYYGIFLVGYFLHMMLQVDAVVRAKSNAAVSRISVLQQNVFVLLSRLFVSFILLVVLRAHPEYLSPILGFAGVTTSSIAIATSSWIFSGAWGYMVDSIMTFIPILKNYVPPLSVDTTTRSVEVTTQPGVEPKTTARVSETHTEPKVQP